MGADWWDDVIMLLSIAQRLGLTVAFVELGR